MAERTRPLGVYVRVSRRGDRDDGRFHSPREQEERSRAHAAARGYTTGPVFVDIDVSGAVHPQERPGMRALLDALDRGEIGGATAFDLSRYSRDPAHGDWLVRRITEAGGVLTSPDMPDDITSAVGEFQFGILLQVARLYRRSAGERIETAKERATRAGMKVGRVPLGYRRDEAGLVELDPETAPVVRELFERRARGEGYSALASLLRERTGREWTRQAVSWILRNRIYATGRVSHGDVISDHEAGAIVDEPLWHAAQRAAPGPRPPRDPDARWLLSGLLKCATCGHNLAPWVGARPKSGREPYRRYRCQNRKCPARTSVDATKAEAWAVLQTVKAGDEMLTRASAPDLGALEARVARTEARLAQVLAPEARDALGELWAADVKARRAERDDALARLGEARSAAGVEASEFRLRDVWADLSPADRREALALFWKEIRVGRRADGGTPMAFVARGPLGEALVTIPAKGEAPSPGPG